MCLVALVGNPSLKNVTSISMPKFVSSTYAGANVVTLVVNDARPISGNSNVITSSDATDNSAPSVNFPNGTLNCRSPAAADSLCIDQACPLSVSPPMGFRQAEPVIYNQPDTRYSIVSCHPGNGLVGPHNNVFPAVGPRSSIKQDTRSYNGLTPVSIPTLEPKTFNGNPANYYSFIDAFDALISFNVPEPNCKLYFLLQCTTGPAHALVKGCRYMPGDQGYYMTRDLLQSIFGQKFQIAKECIDSLINGSNQNQYDKSAMLNFSAELISCMDTLINNFDVLAKIAQRLPHLCIAGWQAELDSIVYIKREEASIKHLASFVSLKIRQATNFECNWSQTHW